MNSLCQPVTLGSDPAAASTDPARLLHLDDTYVYYTSDSVNLIREPKTDTSGSGSTVAVIKSGISFIGSALYWNVRNADVIRCEASNCSATQTQPKDPAAESPPSGKVVENATPSPRLALFIDSCMVNSLFCLRWFNADISVYQEYQDTHQPPSGGYSSSDWYIGAGDCVYWVTSNYTAASVFAKAGLYMACSDLSRGQLAGNLTENTKIIDVNSYSVVLADASGNLWHVSVSLGATSPLPYGVQGVAATEDANTFYWIDSDGNLKTCPKSNCSDTTATLRAIGQANVSRLLQDDTSLYWGRAFTPRVMRMAK